MPGKLPMRKPLSLWGVIFCVALLACCGWPSVVRAGQDESAKYLGPGSCAATSCHGSVKPVADNRILQNEYSTWIIKDKHSKAYQALTGEIGERMARILKLGSKAEEAPKCLACHALNTNRKSTRLNSSHPSISYAV